MLKYKKDNLEEILTATNYYLAPQKDFSTNGIQCDIMTGDPRAMAMEKIDAKKKKPNKVRINKSIKL